jgi:hypothetical protein
MRKFDPFSSMKIQNPTAKIQGNFKDQTSILPPCDVAWSLNFELSLNFGVWILII